MGVHVVLSPPKRMLIKTIEEGKKSDWTHAATTTTTDVIKGRIAHCIIIWLLLFL